MKSHAQPNNCTPARQHWGLKRHPDPWSLCQVFVAPFNIDLPRAPLRKAKRRESLRVRAGTAAGKNEEQQMG